MNTHITSNEQLFSEIVTLLETSILHPFTKFADISNYDELAYVLNTRGLKNSRGEVLKGKSIARYIQRMDKEERQRLREIYYPDVFDEGTLTHQRYEIDRKMRMQFNDAELKAFTKRKPKVPDVANSALGDINIL